MGKNHSSMQVVLRIGSSSCIGLGLSGAKA
jgi:hypothetical protein